MPDPNRAGPATLVTAGDGDDADHDLVDAGRGGGPRPRRQTSFATPLQPVLTAMTLGTDRAAGKVSR